MSYGSCYICGLELGNREVYFSPNCVGGAKTLFGSNW